MGSVQIPFYVKNTKLGAPFCQLKIINENVLKVVKKSLMKPGPTKHQLKNLLESLAIINPKVWLFYKIVPGPENEFDSIN